MAGNGYSGRHRGDDTCPVGTLTLRRAYLNLGSCSALAAHYGVQPATAWRWLKSRGITTQSPGGPNNHRGNPGKRTP